jgi:alpha-glucosidase
MTGRLGASDVNHEVARLVRRTAEAERPDAFVIGEHNHDASADVDGDGWHGTMNYSGFSWPVWSWLRDPSSPARAFGRPVPVPRRDGGAVVDTFRVWQGTLGWRATTSSWNILGSHDSARIRTVVGGDAAVHRVAAGLQFTLPGVPMLFAGDEIGLEGVNGEDARRPMPWDRADQWDRTTLTTYADLARLRRTHPSLRRGGLRWAHVDADTIAFLRELEAESVLVVARRAAAGSFTLPLGPGAHVLGSEPGGGVDLAAVAEGVRVPAADGPRIDVWRLGTE